MPTSRKSRLGGKTPLEAAEMPAMDAVAAAGVVGRANNTPAALPAGSDVANLSLLGYNPLRVLHRPGAAGSRRAGNRAGAGRLGRPLQSGHDRRPDDEELHRRAHLDRGSRGLARDRCRRSSAATELAVLARRQLSEPAGLSRRRPAGAVLARHPHHAAARSDRQDACWTIIPAGRAAICC